jgi:hypothetical protein
MDFVQRLSSNTSALRVSTMNSASRGTSAVCRCCISRIRRHRRVSPLERAERLTPREATSARADSWPFGPSQIMKKLRSGDSDAVDRRLTSPIDQLLRTAIVSKRLIQFDYDDYPRIAEPHDYGEIGGDKQLLIYQIAGKSRSGRLPDWRLVRVAAMKRVRILSKAFPGGRSIPSGKHKKWDQLIARVEAPRNRLQRKDAGD